MIDVLIIGSGGAGLSSALKAKENGSNVLVVSKSMPTYSQTVQAQGGINAVLYEDNDSVDEHINDTYKASHGLAIKENVKFLCENAKDTILWLDSIGVPFNRDEKGNISQRKFGGTKKIRTCYSSDYTGLKIIHTLYDQCIKEEIEFKNEYFLLELIVENSSCKGAIFLDINTGNIEQILAKTTILATGGYAGIYSKNTTNSVLTTGDGIATAFKAGVELSNMEFVQFHPTSMIDNHILISESARGEGGYLVDVDGSRFIDELKPRDEVSRAIYSKLKEGKKVYLDLRHLGLEKIKETIPQERKLAFEFLNIKIEDELLPIVPSAHYTMGGIKTNLNGETNIKNLFACGECANASIHGANRLGGNSLLEIVTLGQNTAIYASNKAKNTNSFLLDDSYINKIKDKIRIILNKENEENFYLLKKDLSNELFTNIGLFRNESNINKFFQKLASINEDFSKSGITDKSDIYNKNLIEYLEFENILLLSKLVSICAKDRKESRGSHYRTDYTTISDEFRFNSLVKLSNDEIVNQFEGIKNEN